MQKCHGRLKQDPELWQCSKESQLLRLSKFSFCNSFSCCAVTDIGSCTASIPRAASISVDSSMGGTGVAETTCATCTSFFRKIGDLDMFLTTTDILLLPILSLVYTCKICSPGERDMPHLAGTLLPLKA